MSSSPSFSFAAGSPAVASVPGAASGSAAGDDAATEPASAGAATSASAFTSTPAASTSNLAFSSAPAPAASAEPSNTSLPACASAPAFSSVAPGGEPAWGSSGFSASAPAFGAATSTASAFDAPASAPAFSSASTPASAPVAGAGFSTAAFPTCASAPAFSPTPDSSPSLPTSSAPAFAFGAASNPSATTTPALAFGPAPGSSFPGGGAFVYPAPAPVLGAQGAQAPWPTFASASGFTFAPAPALGTPSSFSSAPNSTWPPATSGPTCAGTSADLWSFLGRQPPAAGGPSGSAAAFAPPSGTTHAADATGTTAVPYQCTATEDSGASPYYRNVVTLVSISGMPAYANKIHEELRYEDYQAGIKCATSPNTGFAAASAAGAGSFPAVGGSFHAASSAAFGVSSACAYNALAAPFPAASSPCPFTASSICTPDFGALYSRSEGPGAWGFSFPSRDYWHEAEGRCQRGGRGSDSGSDEDDRAHKPARSKSAHDDAAIKVLMGDSEEEICSFPAWREADAVLEEVRQGLPGRLKGPDDLFCTKDMGHLPPGVYRFYKAWEDEGRGQSSGAPSGTAGTGTVTLHFLVDGKERRDLERSCRAGAIAHNLEFAQATATFTATKVATSAGAVRPARCDFGHIIWDEDRRIDSLPRGGYDHVWFECRAPPQGSSWLWRLFWPWS